MRNSKYGNVTKFITVLVVPLLIVMPPFPLYFTLGMELKG